MSAVVNPAGWSVWNSRAATPENMSTVYYGEYENEGPGSQGRRANFVTKLNKAVSLNQILPGVAGWGDMRYLNSSLIT
jgi:hypothetical protein